MSPDPSVSKACLLLRMELLHLSAAEELPIF